MKKYEFMQVDAFTEIAFGGNPCAIFFDTQDLNDEMMLLITREMNLSESSFVRHSSIADFGVRYFTPIGEIPLAGHPTIATTFALIDSGRLQLTGNITKIHLELQVGPIPVEIQSENGQVKNITMSQMKPQFMKVYDPELVLPVFGLNEDDLFPNTPIQTVSTGTPQLMICVKNIDILQELHPDIRMYRELHQQSDWFSTHIFCPQGITSLGNTFARHFSPSPDIFEDPFTGSATGGMAAFLWHYGLLETPAFIAEQGHWMKRPGQASVEVIGSRENIETIKVGGSAVTVLSGTLNLLDIF